jgi:MFS family permease
MQLRDQRGEQPGLFPRAIPFWFLAVVLVLLLAAASAPSPVYGLYQAMWGFPPITLTAIYGVYAVGGLAALLFFGRLPDHLGRRPVLAVALVIEIAGMLAFVIADGVEALFVGRFLAGAGVGLGAGAVSAWLLDLQPGHKPGLGGLVSGVGPLLGLGLGGFVSSVFVQYGPDPLHLVFWLLAGAYALGLVGILAISDPVDRRPGWLASIRPTVGVPSAARSTFTAGLPVLVALWALAGMYLSLGPSVAVSLLDSDSRLAGGTIILALTGVGAIASVVVASAAPHVVLVRGSLLLILGVAVTLVGVWARSIVLLFAGSVIAGLGFGPAFSAFVGSTVPLARPERRAALVAAIYVVVYVSISVPAIVGGAGATAFGLRDTFVIYGVVVIALGAATTVGVSRRLRSATNEPR